MNVLLCPHSEPGFLYSALAIGREICRRGHDVRVLCRRSATWAVKEAGLGVLPAGNFGAETAFSVARAGFTGVEQFVIVRCALREMAADAVLTSILCHGALLAAEDLDLPAAVLGLATYLWPYRARGDDDPEAMLRHRLLHDLLRHYHAVRRLVAMSQRRDRVPERALIGSALLLRGDPALERPGGILPAGVYHVGPCAWEPQADPIELNDIARRLTEVGKPVVYAHLGGPSVETAYGHS